MSELFSKSVERLVKLEAMKAENSMRIIRGESPAYGEEQFLKLLEDD